MVVFLNMEESLNFFFIFVIFIMFFFCLYFYLGNKKLKERIENLEKETKEILERKIFQGEEKDLVSMQDLSLEKAVPKSEQNVQSNDIRAKVKYEPTLFPNFKLNDSIDKKVSDNLSKFNDESKASIHSNDLSGFKDDSKEEKSLSQVKTISSDDLIFLDDDLKKNKEVLVQPTVCFDLNEFVQTSSRKSSDTSLKSETDYLQNVSRKMADELKPQTIELTDYEKDQEEHAVISYQELLNLKNGISVADDEQETLRLIDELKKLRNHLS